MYVYVIARHETASNHRNELTCKISQRAGTGSPRLLYNARRKNTMVKSYMLKDSARGAEIIEKWNQRMADRDPSRGKLG